MTGGVGIMGSLLTEIMTGAVLGVDAVTQVGDQVDGAEAENGNADKVGIGCGDGDRGEVGDSGEEGTVEDGDEGADDEDDDEEDTDCGDNGAHN